MKPRVGKENLLIHPFLSLIMYHFLQGNIHFTGDGEYSEISNESELEWVAKVLNTSKESIKKALCYRVVAARGEVMEKSHNVKEAFHGRDALAKVSIESTSSGPIPAS